MSTTFALMTRIQLIEAPYLNEFIEYYRNIGINHIYFINTEPKNLDKIKETISSILLKDITFYNHTGSINDFSYCRKLFTQIKQDYILHVDSDEFLLLPKDTPNLSHVVEKYKNTDIFIFKWTFIVVNKLFQSCMLDYLNDDNAVYNDYPARKVMFKRKQWLKDLNSTISPHMVYFNTPNKIRTFEPLKTDPFILHFCVRNYLHTIEKCKNQRLKNDTEKSLIEMLNKSEPQYSKIHFRFKILVALLGTSTGLVKDLALQEHFYIPFCNCSKNKNDLTDEYQLYEKIQKLSEQIKENQKAQNISKQNITLLDYTRKISKILN